ncbi:MAG: hypothetical protein MUE95_15450 [Cyclobacteriaceae bacterium]|nr:hypothetical protein [Cyclobacteriaceae bacterium]
MRIAFVKFFAASVVFACCLPMAYAQQEEGGELKPVEIEIVKERQITLPQANRLYDKIPPRPAEPIKPEITYSFRPLTFRTPEVSPAIRPLRLKQEENADVNGGFFSAGYGNYASPFLEAFINTKEDKNKLLGAHAYHSSSGKGPVDGKNSGNGNSGLSLFAQSFGKDVTFQADAGYDNRMTHFYGYPAGKEVDRDTIRQSYNLFTAGLSIANSKNTDFSYELGGRYSYLTDRYDASESTIGLDFKGAYKISDENNLVIKANYVIINRQDSLVAKKSRSLFQVNPYYSMRTADNLKLRIGAVLAMENDTLDSRDLHFYPDVSVVYPLSPSMDVVGTLTGGIDQVSLQSLVRENLWLGQGFPIYHTNRLYDLQAAINARANSNIYLSAGFSFAALKNLYFYVNETADVSRFTTVYDEGSTKRTNFFAAVAMTYSTRTKLSIRGDYFTYGTDSEPEAWHRPAYKFNLSGSYNLQDKIVVSGEIIALGGIKARDPLTLQAVRLDPAFDLNLRVEYLFSKRVSAFIDLNNITSNTYQVLLNYPVRGFQAMGGITWSF